MVIPWGVRIGLLHHFEIHHNSRSLRGEQCNQRVSFLKSDRLKAPATGSSFLRHDLLNGFHLSQASSLDGQVVEDVEIVDGNHPMPPSPAGAGRGPHR